MQGIINSDHYEKKAGLCAIINDHLSLAYKHYLEFGNLDLVINNRELSTIFDFDLRISEENSYDLLKRHKYFDNPFSSNAHNIPVRSQLKMKKWVFENIFKIKPKVQQKFTFDAAKPDKIAIHYRGTDKKYEVKPPNLNKLFQELQNKLQTEEQDSFYLATDDLRILNKFNNFFGDAVIYHNKNHFSKKLPLHFSKNRYDVNFELLNDVFRLAQSEHFYYSYSNVSHLALILGIDNNQRIYQINDSWAGFL